MDWFESKCNATCDKIEQLYHDCAVVKGSELWKDSVLLQTEIHKYCLKGSILFAESFRIYQKKEYKKCFFLLGNAVEAYNTADSAMREREHGKWTGFYANDCLTDVKETAYCLKRLMGYVRNLGDGPDFYKWQREVTYSENDAKVVLITNMENHMTDWELYLVGKNMQG